MSNEQYKTSEVMRAKRELSRVEKYPLAFRQQGRESFGLCLANQPDRIASEVDHILSGNYGYGFKVMAWRAIDESPRMNHPALFSQWVANRCWGCSASFARQAWNTLTDSQKTAITQSILDVISDHKDER